eukprot:m.667 g.667  ORF g.667 m.667 type:complete len:281 (+) comp486_c0_seq1:357-1199(+)
MEEDAPTNGEFNSPYTLFERTGFPFFDNSSLTDDVPPWNDNVPPLNDNDLPLNDNLSALPPPITTFLNHRVTGDTSFNVESESGISTNDIHMHDFPPPPIKEQFSVAMERNLHSPIPHNYDDIRREPPPKPRKNEAKTMPRKKNKRGLNVRDPNKITTATKGTRKVYRCSKCGSIKKNHICPKADEKKPRRTSRPGKYTDPSYVSTPPPPPSTSAIYSTSTSTGIPTRLLVLPNLTHSNFGLGFELPASVGNFMAQYRCTQINPETASTSKFTANYFDSK